MKKIALLLFLLSVFSTQASASNCAGDHINRTNNQITVSYCNLGGYTVKKFKVTLYRDDEYVKSSTSRASLDWGQYSLLGFDFKLTEGDYKLKVQYWLSAGTGANKSRKCYHTFKLPANTTDFELKWDTYSKGTLTTSNKCRDHLWYYKIDYTL